MRPSLGARWDAQRRSAFGFAALVWQAEQFPAQSAVRCFGYICLLELGWIPDVVDERRRELDPDNLVLRYLENVRGARWEGAAVSPNARAVAGDHLAAVDPPAGKGVVARSE